MLKDSTVFAKLEMEVLRAFTSKYALALYEAVARRVRLKHIFTERFSMDDFRELLGVEPPLLWVFRSHFKSLTSPLPLQSACNVVQYATGLSAVPFPNTCKKHFRFQKLRQNLYLECKIYGNHSGNFVWRIRDQTLAAIAQVVSQAIRTTSW